MAKRKRKKKKWETTKWPVPKGFEYLPFEEARQVAWGHAAQLHIVSQLQWEKAWYNYGLWRTGVPLKPAEFYPEQWVSRADFLGYAPELGNDHSIRPFKEAREHVRSLSFTDYGDYFYKWASTSARPDDIPQYPNLDYKEDGWVDDLDWLGLYFSFEEAKKFARSLGLNNRKEWLHYCKHGPMPFGMPTDPRKVYGKKWDIR